MKRVAFIFLFLSVWLVGLSQTDSNPLPLLDTTVTKPVRPAIRKRPLIVKVDSVRLKDSKRIADSVALHSFSGDTTLKDTIITDTLTRKVVPVAPKVFTGIDCTYAHFLQNPLLPMHGKGIYQILKFRESNSKDELFYLVAGLVLFLAFIKLAFSRYFRNIFRLLLQPSFRQKQTREQLMQNSLPSLLLNLFFLFSGGAYVALLFRYMGVLPVSFWLLFLYSTLVLCILYVAKFLFLSFSGWVFHVKEAIDTYMFTVYLINKIIGVLLLPFILILAFSQPAVIQVSVTISALLLILLFLYRYVISYAPVRRDVSVSPLHFLIYIFAFEITPLLLIYKTLMLYLARTL